MISKFRPPAVDAREIRILEKCKELGIEVKRMDYFFLDPEKYPISKSIAEFIAEEIEHSSDGSWNAALFQVGVWPQYRQIFLPLLIREIEKGVDHRGASGAINSLSKVVKKGDDALLAGLLENDRIGYLRTLIMPDYVKVARKAAIPLLRKLVSDPNLQAQALRHLALLGDTSIEAELNELANHTNSNHRKIAREALKRVEKNKTKAAKSTLQ